MLLEQYAKDDLILVKRPHAHIVVGNKLCDIWLLDTKSQSFHHCSTASLLHCAHKHTGHCCTEGRMFINQVVEPAVHLLAQIDRYLRR